MTDSASRSISLNDIGLRYFATLQRLSDVIVFTWAGARSVSEQGYEEVARSVPGLPASQFRVPFHTAREEAERLWLKQSINELLGLCMVFLEDVRKLAALVTFNAARARATGDLASLAAEVNAALGQSDPETRVKQLRERYGIYSPEESELLSLAGFARSLFVNGGIVPNGAAVTLQLKMLQPPEPEDSEPRFGEFQRIWMAGEIIALTREQHAAIFTTLSIFIGGMLAAVQEYAQRSGLSEEPLPQ